MTTTESAKFIDLCDNMCLTINQREAWQEFVNQVSDDAFDRGANTGDSLEATKHESEER